MSKKPKAAKPKVVGMINVIEPETETAKVKVEVSNAVKLKHLEQVAQIATQSGNYDANPYLWGMANGLILAEAIMNNKTPVYLDRPKFSKEK